MGEFEGVADVYEESRRGYPTELRDHLITIGALAPESLVLDLGAGTGQLVRLVATTAAQVVALEPEPDMVEVGRRVTADLSNVRWIEGADADVPRHFAAGEIDLVTIGNAFHHMDQPQLLKDLDRLVSPAGWVCVVASSVPVWLQDSDWSNALRAVLEAELGPLSGSGVPDSAETAALLADSAFDDVSGWSLHRSGVRSCDSAVGEIVSSTSGQLDASILERLRASIATSVRRRRST